MVVLYDDSAETVGRGGAVESAKGLRKQGVHMAR